VAISHLTLRTGREPIHLRTSIALDGPAGQVQKNDRLTVVLGLLLPSALRRPSTAPGTGHQTSVPIAKIAAEGANRGAVEKRKHGGFMRRRREGGWRFLVVNMSALIFLLGSTFFVLTLAKVRRVEGAETRSATAKQRVGRSCRWRCRLWTGLSAALTPFGLIVLHLTIGQEEPATGLEGSGCVVAAPPTLD